MKKRYYLLIVLLTLLATTITHAQNNPPVIENLNGDTVTLQAGGPAARIDQGGNATVTDMDSPHFNGGYLEIVDKDANNTVNGNFSVDGINVTSGGDGTIAAGETIAVGGTSIGTVLPTDDNTLTISFNSNATPSRIQTMIRNIAWAAPSGDGDQTFALVLSDGAGNNSAPAGFTMNLTALGQHSHFVASTGNDDAGTNNCTDQSAPCRTIGHAINVAPEGSSIHIAEGTYNEYNLDVEKNLSIIGDGAASTIVDAEGQGRLFWIQDDASVTISSLTLTGGNFAGDGGGIRVGGSGTLNLSNAIVRNNTASGSGGGIAVRENANAMLVNVVVAGNTAGDIGGGLRLAGNNATLINVTLSGNSAANFWDGISNSSSNLEIANVISWNNIGEGGGDEISGGGTISHSLIAGGCPSGSNCTNVIDADPLFTDPNNGDFTLQETSPAINAGSNQAYSDAGGDLANDMDLAGNSRLYDGDPADDVIDMGAYELQGDPVGTITPDENNILYVDTNVSGGNQTGDSWANALPELADALQWAEDNWDGDTDGTLQIWVAEGVYHPVEPADPNNVTETERQATFQLVNHVEIYGGFDPGNGIVDLDDERMLPSTGGTGTILSGDIDGNDSATIITDPGTEIQGNNSYSVVNGTSTDNTALLNGVTITGGKADGATSGDSAPGSGGGIYIDGGAPALAHLAVSGNRAEVYGGGMHNRGDPTITNVTFVSNSAGSTGGGMDNSGDPTLTNVTFTGNSADTYGGGLYNSGAPTIINATFTGNNAGHSGGGMYNRGNPTLTNTTFTGNSADIDGGGIYNNYGSTLTLTNSILWGNSAGSDGNEMYNRSNDVVGDVTVTLSHSLYANGTNDIENDDIDGGTITFDETASLHEDPQFTDPGNGDYSLQNTSPAVNTGDPGTEMSLFPVNESGEPIDLAGQPRVFDDNIDLGAYEYQEELNQAPDFTSTPDTTAKEGTLYSYAIEATDPDGDALTLTAIQKPGWATFTDHEDGTATLEGTPGFDDSGGHEVALEVSDGELAGTQAFIITVADSNRTPHITTEPVTGAQEGETYTYTIEASDPDGDSLSITAPELPDWSAFTDHGDGTGTLEGTPGFDAEGIYSVELIVSDGAADTTQTFEITIGGSNRGPAFTSEPVTRAQEGATYTYEIEGHDPDGDSLSFAATEIPDWAGLTDHGDGTALLQGTPGFDTEGTQPVTITLSDGALDTAQTFEIAIADSNRAPAITSAPVTRAQEETPYAYEVRAADADGDPLSFTATEKPDWASLTTTSDSTARLEGTPEFGDHGDFPVELEVSDGTLTDRQAFTITVADTNRAPAFTSEPVTEGREGTPYLYEIAGSDPDGDVLDIRASEHPGWLTLTATSDSTASLEGTPGFEASGDYGITLELSDGVLADSQSFTITIADSNRVPTITSEPVTEAKEGEAYAYTIEASDPDGDTLSITAPELPDWSAFTDHGDGTGTLKGTPGFDAEGIYSVDLLVSDGAADTTQTFEITIGGSNRGPEFSSEPVTSAREGTEYSYQVMAADADGDSLNFSAETIPDWASLTADSDTSATLKGTPGFDAEGTYPVELVVSDGVAENTQTFEIVVEGSNRGPSFTSEPVTGGKEGEAYIYTIETSDPDGDTLSITATDIPGWASLQDQGDGTADLEGTPGFGDSGDYDIELEVSDGTTTATQTFTITVSSTNRQPEILSQPTLQVPSERSYRYVVAAIDTAGSDSGGQLTFDAELDSGAPLPEWLSWQEVPDDGPVQRMALVGTPPASAIGTYAIVLSVADGEDPPLSAEQRFTLRVTQGNQQPTISSSPVEVIRMNNVYSYTVEASDPDADNVTFAANLSDGKELPKWLSLQKSSDTTAVLTGKPKEEDIGTYDITIRATDSGTPQKETSQAFTLEVKYKEVEELKALYNYPNPFNNATKIKFELPEEGEVYMQLYNTTGALIRQTAPQVFEPGANEFELRARNLASGIYIYRIVSEQEEVTGRMTLIR